MPTNLQPVLALNQVVAMTGDYPDVENGNAGLPMGIIRTFATTYAPGELPLANGQIVSAPQNSALFALLGVNYGGNGTSTFALPNLGGSVSVGIGQGPGLSPHFIGQAEGSASVDLNFTNLTFQAHGSYIPFSNVQPTLTTNFVINANGDWPTSGSLASIGIVYQDLSTRIPANTLRCDGQLLNIADYPSLFSVIGTTYGGDGDTTFALPDLRGRTIVGEGNGYVTGQMLGTENSTLTNATMPVQMGGSGQAINNVGPSLVMHQMVVVEGIYPSRFSGSIDPTDPVMGEIITFAGPASLLPGNFVEAKGQILPIAQNSALFSLLGTSYGGNGQTDFALPNLGGRAVIGTDDAHAIGQTEGVESYTLNMADIPANGSFSGYESVGDHLYGANDDNQISGLSGNDFLYGNGGNDRLDGGIGADRMEGGTGNDTYYVDSLSDVVVEYANQGTDRIVSSISLTLGDFVENLFLSGTDNINATGNTLNNGLIGNDGNNVLDGVSGADTLTGGKGDDTYIVNSDDGVDKIVELDGQGHDLVKSGSSFALTGIFVEDLVLTGTGNTTGRGNGLENHITGNSGNNTLFGEGGSDILDGGAGADTLRGGLGDDLFIVDNAGDNVVELAEEGNDTIEASVSYSLAGRFVETLKLTGTANLNGTGNGQSNTITGNAGANTLSGLAGNDVLDGDAGADTMYGGNDDDIYIVDNIGDKAVESATDTGYDTVMSSVTYSIVGQYIESLVLTGTGAINGCGNSLDNIIFGNNADNLLRGMDGSDELHGGRGADKLSGGAGADYFVFDSPLGDVDTILDFKHGEDTMVLLSPIFGWMDSFNADNFVIGTVAQDADDRIVYDKVTGNLYFDADGSGAGEAVLFAKLVANTLLAADDFQITFGQ